MFLKTLGAALAAIALATACGEQGRTQLASLDKSIDMYLGPADAKVTVIEYGSPTCPGCKFWHDNHLQQLKDGYINTGKVKFIFREFAIHGAIDAAIFSIARCTGQEDFFKVLDEAYADQRQIVTDASSGRAIEAMNKLGEKFKLTPDQVKTCMNDPNAIARINDVGAYTKQIGVSSTPTFFVDKTLMNEPDLSKVWDQMKAAIDARLSGQPIAAAPAAAPSETPATGDGHEHVPGEQH
jgi:protein-disulfide isomerase